MERKIQIKLVAVSNVELKEGQEIDATITVSETGGFYNAEIKEGLVVLAHQLPDPQQPTGYWSALGVRPPTARNR